MDGGHSSGSSTVYIYQFSVIRRAKVDGNVGNSAFFFNPEIPGLSHDNPGISGLEKWVGIPGLQSLMITIECVIFHLPLHAV